MSNFTIYHLLFYNLERLHRFFMRNMELRVLVFLIFSIKYFI